MRATLLDSYLTLLQVGLPSHELLPAVRCALTAPFHPYPSPIKIGSGRYIFCCTRREFSPPGVTWHPALWSPDFPPLIFLMRKERIIQQAAIAQLTQVADYRNIWF